MAIESPINNSHKGQLLKVTMVNPETKKKINVDDRFKQGAIDMGYTEEIPFVYPKSTEEVAQEAANVGATEAANQIIARAETAAEGILNATSAKVDKMVADAAEKIAAMQAPATKTTEGGEGSGDGGKPYASKFKSPLTCYEAAIKRLADVQKDDLIWAVKEAGGEVVDDDTKNKLVDKLDKLVGSSD